MRQAVVMMLASLSVAGFTGCDTQAEPNNAMFGYRVDWQNNRTWWLTGDEVQLHSAEKARTVVPLPGWLWLGAPHCPPDLALGPGSEAVVTSNVTPILWRIDPRTLAVSVHQLQLGADAGKDVGFAAIVYSAEQEAFFAYSEVHSSVWKIDRDLIRATKVANTDMGHTRAPRMTTVRGPCAHLRQRLMQFAGLPGD